MASSISTGDMLAGVMRATADAFEQAARDALTEKLRAVADQVIAEVVGAAVDRVHALWAAELSLIGRSIKIDGKISISDTTSSDFS